jgi:hypothetical protein
VFTLTQSLADQREVEEGKKLNIEFLEARKDSTEALQPAEQTLDLVAAGGPGFQRL